MNKGLLRIIFGLTIMTISAVNIGRNLECRKIVYEAEKNGGGFITYIDILGNYHTAYVEAE